MREYRLIITQRGGDQSAPGEVLNENLWAENDDEAIRIAKMKQLSFYLVGDYVTLKNGLGEVIWHLTPGENSDA